MLIKHKLPGISRGRCFTTDSAFLLRMPAGIPGEVNRQWASVIESVGITGAGLTNAPTAYGQPVVIDATSQLARMLTAGDTAIYGVLARPFPISSAGSGGVVPGTNYPYGAGSVPASGAVDVLRSGYISVVLNTGATNAVKGGLVYVWIAATTTGHAQDGWETSSSGGNTINVPNWYYMGAADANGNTEVSINA